jgi:excisionase family DNA binding protein
MLMQTGALSAQQTRCKKMQEIKTIQQGFVRPAQAAKYLNVSPRTIRAWLAGQRIPFAKVGHKVVLIRLADIDEFVLRHSDAVQQ